MKHSRQIAISNAQFANVAFSNGSLLDCFHYRIQKVQPIAAPEDVKRYFITQKKSAELALPFHKNGHHRRKNHGGISFR